MSGKPNDKKPTYHLGMASTTHMVILAMVYWLVVWNMAVIFHFIYGIILPIDFHIFQDG
jgi:hypothetical protein